MENIRKTIIEKVRDINNYKNRIIRKSKNRKGKK